MFFNNKDKTERLKLSAKLLKAERSFARKVKKLEREVTALEEAARLRYEPIVLMDKKVPQSAQEREKFVTDVTVFYNNVFKARLAEMINDQKDELARMDLGEKMSDIIRSNINCLHLFKDWFERLEVEHLGDLQVKRERQEEDESISRLRSQV